MAKQTNGIRTLDDLRARSVIDDITQCWAYQVARRSAGKDWYVNVWLPDHKRTETLQRAAWLLAGKPVGRGGRDWTVWRKCRNELCCNPAHLMAGPRRAFGQWLESTGKLRGDPKRVAINRRNALANGQRTTLTPELAEWIRQSEQSGIEIAHALGVSKHSVSRVRLGQTWAPTVRGASVFAWAAAQGSR